ncbi:MAG TPA: chemotaxis protein CheB [Candidatus Dormibacteraeota bacterium]|nr:chemotaxis protein CheB [Candidatus Dormibacteraeota bacterium]
MVAAQRVVVVGGSAGGLEALTTLVSRLPGDLPAAVLAVLHFPPDAGSRLAPILARSTDLAVSVPWDGEPLQAGRIYLPTPDQHLLAGRGRVELSRAPRENGHRPAVDALFRSAARAYGPAAVGVVLCGNLDDGSAGLLVLRRAGGIGVVMDPEGCDFADMPRNAIAVADPEHVVPVGAMGPLIAELVAEPPATGRTLSMLPSTAGDEESQVGTQGAAIAWGDDRPGRPSGFSCPECHGVLWEVDQPGLPGFACRIGHRMSAQSLFDLRGEEVEGALWAAVRSLEEQASLADRLSDRAGDLGHAITRDRYRRRGDDARLQAEVLRRAALRPDDTSRGEAEG